MSNDNITPPDALAVADCANTFQQRFPSSNFNPHATRYVDDLEPGPRWTWVCDGCGQDARDGIAVFCDPQSRRRYPQGTTCVIGVFCSRHRPRHQAYQLPLSELRGNAFVDSMRQLLEKSWFGQSEAHALCDRYLRGLHLKSSSQ